MDNLAIRSLNEAIQERCRYTPDYPELLNQRLHLFFIVDNFQYGCPNNHLLGDSAYGCRAFTWSGVECFRGPLTDRVVPFYEARSPEVIDRKYFARIKGEVWKVPTKQIPVLDTEMRNGVQFKRHRITLLASERDHQLEENRWHKHITGAPRFKHIVSEERTVILRAWMYLAKRNYWNPIIDGLSYDRLEMKDDDRPWLRRYYQFNKRRNE